MTGPAPVGTIHVVDPPPLNWLFITWNTMEEPIRIDEDGRTVFALVESADWTDERTLQLTLRRGVRFQDGEPFTAHNIKLNFDEMQRWVAPHPPGTYSTSRPSRCARSSTTTPSGSTSPAPTGWRWARCAGSTSPRPRSGRARTPPASATRSSAPAKATGE